MEFVDSLLLWVGAGAVGDSVMLSLLSASGSSTGPACFDRNRLVVVVECGGGIDTAPSCHSCSMRCRVRGGLGKGRIGWNGTAAARFIDCSIHGPTLVIVTRGSPQPCLSPRLLGNAIIVLVLWTFFVWFPLLQLFFLLSSQFESSTFGASQYKGCHAPLERHCEVRTTRSRRHL